MTYYAQGISSKSKHVSYQKLWSSEDSRVTYSNSWKKKPVIQEFCTQKRCLQSWEMKRYIHTKTCTQMFIALFCNNQNIEVTKISWWMDKQYAVCSFSRQWFITTKEWSIDNCCSRSKHWKHARWKKPDTKGHILYDPIYIKCPEQTDLYRKRLVVVSGGLGKRNGKWLFMFFFCFLLFFVFLLKWW